MFEFWNGFVAVDATIRVFVTDPDAPRSALVYSSYDGIFLGGEPDRELVKYGELGDDIVIPLSEEWEKLIRECYPEAEPTIRYAIHRCKEFDREKLQSFVDALPEGYEIRRIDGEIYDLILISDDDDLEDLIGEFETKEAFLEKGRGFAVLKDGKVIRKWSHNRLPDEYDLARPLEELELGQAAGNTMGRHIAEVMLWFVLPLLLLSITDRLWMWSKWIRKRKNSNSINKKEVKMRKKIVAGNWKMNMNLQDGIALAKELNETLKAEKPNCGVVICTPFIHLASIAQFLDQNIIGLGAENCADKEKGAFTGEVSAEMVKSTGAQYVILGHSERREYYKETPEILKEKVLLAQKNDLKVIFCIGESLEEREAGKQNEVVKAELEGSVFNLSEEDFRKIVIAYEPIWAIGTGKTATAEQAEEIHAYIRSIIAEKYGQAVADDTTILYGGSCKASNAPELFAKPDIDGGLIGGASLKAADFKGIIDAFKK